MPLLGVVLPRIAAAILIVTVCACASPPTWSEKAIQDAAIVWFNETGLKQMDEDVWNDRLDALCANDPDYFGLAEQYVAEDAPLSSRSDGSLPDIKKAYRSLYGIRLQTCGR
jgi:hypothetical protein